MGIGPLFRQVGLGIASTYDIEDVLLYPMPKDIKLSRMLAATYLVKSDVFLTEIGCGYFHLYDENSLLFLMEKSPKKYHLDADATLSIDDKRLIGIPNYHVGHRIIVEYKQATREQLSKVSDKWAANGTGIPISILQVETLSMFQNGLPVNTILGCDIAQCLTK